MDKRYQIFVSSTYSDLKDERQSVIQALMEMDCIPAGMELFPAADEEQWIFIQKIIDDCDYYLLILGGRYGSITDDGISYTEKEFDYAVSKGIKVVALVHGSPEQLPFEKVEASESARKKLSDFREKVCTGRLIKFWKDAGELPGLVALSLQKTIKMFPGVGWVRGNQASNHDLLEQINALRIENDALRIRNPASAINIKEIPKDLAGGSEIYSLRFIKREEYNFDITRRQVEIKETWDSIFRMVGPCVLAAKSQEKVKEEIHNIILEKYNPGDIYVSYKIEENSFATIAIQFHESGLINVEAEKMNDGEQNVLWKITDYGRSYLAKLMVVKSAKNEAP